ncbi:hypothetical protein TrST_g2222 [Triparma strigata]|uniref:Uncharacterized protein n=1 Tax=Triparma strigata TaxID=1606541 RepID=A0A9W6ZR70_9STRA|nr:hypothetical protein TrST_g2222 [Triparma strigata]
MIPHPTAASPTYDPTVKILHAAYISKRAHSNLRWKTRYVVLTPTHLHWFKKQPGDSLFGYELGCVEVKSISRVEKGAGVGDGWSYFEVEAIEEDGWVSAEPFVRHFRVETRKERETWVKMLTATMKGEVVTSSASSAFGTHTGGSSFHVYPTLLTDHKKQVPLLSVGSLPVLPGWDSRPFFLKSRGILHFTNGQTVEVPTEKISQLFVKPNPVPEQFELAAKERGIVVPLIEFVKFKIEPLDTSTSVNSQVVAAVAFVAMVVAATGGQVPGVHEVPYFLLPGAVVGGVLWHLTVPSKTYSVTMLEVKMVAIEEEMEEEEEDDEENIPPVPSRFIEGLKDQGGLPEATRRWKATAEWRKKFSIDTLLTKPLPEFTAIKESYPLYYHGLTKPVFPDGKGGFYSHLIYIERPGKCDMEKLSAIGLPSLCQFMRFLTEWVYTYLAPMEHSKIFNIVDVEDFKLTELKGDRLDFFKFVTGLSQDHYPERASVIAVVNAPSWFTMLFRLIKPMINENTQKKIRVMSSKDTYNGLLEFLDDDRIPVEYGGSCSYKDSNGEKISCREGTEMERAMLDYVNRLNSGKPLPRPPHWNREDVLLPQKDLANNDRIWEGDKNDPFYVSDIHLPLKQQKSKFALTAQGFIGADGRPIFSIDNPEPTGSATRSSSLPPSPSRTDNSKFVPIGIRPHSASMNSSERSDGETESEPEAVQKRLLPRRDSTLNFRNENDKQKDHYGDSDSGSDSEDDRPRRPSHSLRTASAASSSEGGSWFTQNLPQPTKVLHEGWIYKKATGEGFFGRRNWAPRWAKLVEAIVPPPVEGFSPPTQTAHSTEPVPVLMMYWYESSVTPSSFIVLDDCVTVPVDRSAEEWNSHCFDLVHLPAKRQTRSFSALNAAQRDEWVSKVNKVLSAFCQK